MTADTDVLDSAFDRVSALDFEVPNRFVNHGPMACEALATMGYPDRIGEWVYGLEEMMGQAVAPVAPRWGQTWDWRDVAGDYRRLPEWMGFFARSVDEDGWQAVVKDWVPRFMPALSSALYHGVIRTAHAVRAIDLVDSPSRRAELARALGNWATWYNPGAPPGPAPVGNDAEGAAVAAAAAGARAYTASPTIFYLHGVTGAMAVALLSSHLAPADGAAAVVQLRADHQQLYGRQPSSPSSGPTPDWDPDVADHAAASHDAHQIKLVEACQRGFTASGDPAFAEAARTVTHTGSRPPTSTNLSTRSAS
jgi:Questin oxidase-like